MLHPERAESIRTYVVRSTQTQNLTRRIASCFARPKHFQTRLYMLRLLSEFTVVSAIPSFIYPLISERIVAVPIRSSCRDSLLNTRRLTREMQSSSLPNGSTIGNVFERGDDSIATASNDASGGGSSSGGVAKNLARPNILDLQPYRCARDDYSVGILLDANENPIS
jgi:hypothetical protein